MAVTPEMGAKFSPPPFGIVVQSDDGADTLINVVADAGWHVWNEVSFDVTPAGVEISIDLEGQSAPEDVKEHVFVQVLRAKEGESRHRLLARGLADHYGSSRSCHLEARTPDWWRRPIYCGWGDQVGTALWLEGPGPERRALAYSTQGLYERWIRRLDQAGVPVGTVIIDAGWSSPGIWEPNASHWPGLRGFIDRQHVAGRHVLLWLGAWLHDGLPNEWCISIGRERVCADPTNPAYVDHVRDQVQQLLAHTGFDADGFKLDQLSRGPRVRGPSDKVSLAGTGWGCELLYRLQKTIYDAAKQAKPDALVTSSTVHPYFADTLDMVRLHDTGTIPRDVVGAMEARAKLAEAALPGAPIDTDDWITRDYQAWMRYTIHSPQIGVPCIFYTERFVTSWDATPATRLVKPQELRQIGLAWRQAGHTNSFRPALDQ